jgi:predicted DNA-binding transcriptional regulator AlpA
MSEAAQVEDELLVTEPEAARILAISVRTLQAWRVQDAGPPYVRVGRLIRYVRSSLIAWVKSRTHTPGGRG